MSTEMSLQAAVSREGCVTDETFVIFSARVSLHVSLQNARGYKTSGTLYTLIWLLTC